MHGIEKWEARHANENGQFNLSSRGGAKRPSGGGLNKSSDGSVLIEPSEVKKLL